MQKILPKKNLPDFINNLIKSNQVIAPVNSKPTKFQKITNISQLPTTHYPLPTTVPFKQHLIPENETLLKFEKDSLKEVADEVSKTIIFGLRKCDLNAIQILDKVMYDPQYLSKRKNQILIGLFCDSPDKFCFCNSMKLENFHDLFFYPKGENYIIDVGSEKGAELVKDLQTLEKEIKIPDPKNSKKLKTLDIASHYKNPIWKKDANKCLSCSACTVYCPTCNCFDIKDNLNLDLKSGNRVRRQASCQLKSFSKVAGGKSYRDSRLSRFKQFVYHKISYFQKQHERPMCVGCGRCLRVCPTKIDWVETINSLPKKK